MLLEQKYILYDVIFRLGIIITGGFIQLLLHISTFSPIQESPPNYTQIPYFTDWSPLFSSSFIILFAFISKKHSKMSKDLFSSCLFPAILILIYYVIIYFFIQPALGSKLDGFDISGNLLGSGVGNGILLRNYAWMKRHEDHINKNIFKAVTIVIIAVLVYVCYENLWTTAYYHTVIEALASFGLATLNIIFPSYEEFKKKGLNEEAQEDFYIKNQDEVDIELPTRYSSRPKITILDPK